MKKYYNLNEGYLSKLDDNNETLISAVDVDNIDKYSKIEKDDKQSFEDFKAQYKGVIDMKCTQDYGNCEDKDLWEDCAKELFLTSKNYLLQGDEYKAPGLEKKTENKQLTESNDINVGDEYINDYGAKITILEPTKDGEYQFKVTNTKTGVEGDVLATRSMKHVLDMNGYKKVESKNSTDRYQLRKFPSEQEYKGEWGAYDTKEDKFVQKGSRYVMKAAIIDLNRKDSKTESKINDIIANKGILNEIKTFNDKTIRDSFLNMCELEQISIRNQIQVLQECRRLIGKEPLTESNDDNYTNQDIRKAVKKVLDKDRNVFTDDSIYDVAQVLTGISDIDKMPENLLDQIRNVVEKDRQRKTKRRVKKEKKTEGTAQKRIARYGEFDNGYVLHNDWREMSDEEAEELAKQASIKDPTDVYYVHYDDIMNPSNDIRWYKGKSYTVDEINEIRKKEKYALYKKMMQAELEEQCKRFKDLTSLTEDQYENERRKGRPSIRKIADEEYYDNEEWYKNHIKDYKDVDDFIKQEIFEIASEYNLKEDTAIQVCKEIYNLAIKNQSKTESFKITDPRDKRRKLIVPDEIENVLNSSKFKEIKSVIKKHDGITSNPKIYIEDNKLGINYSFHGFNDEEHMKIFSDLGFNDLDSISNGQLHGWGYSQYEASINIEGISVIISYSTGVRIISIQTDYPLKEDTANNEPFYRYDNQENFEKAKSEYQRNPNEETLKAFKDARSAFEKEINAKKRID